jgi:hypothetical protein
MNVPRLGGALALAVVLAGCSVSPQDRPEQISLNTVTPPAATSSVTLIPVTTPGGVCLVQYGRLVWADRQVPYHHVLNGTLALLAKGPTAAEARQAIRSALPAGTTGLVAQVRGNVAMIAVPKGFDDLSASEQVLAVAQLTYTVTQIKGITALQLTVSGRPVSMPVESGGPGGLVPGPVTRADFRALAPR